MGNKVQHQGHSAGETGRRECTQLAHLGLTLTWEHASAISCDLGIGFLSTAFGIGRDSRGFSLGRSLWVVAGSGGGGAGGAGAAVKR